MIDYIQPDYEVVRNKELCIKCKVCVRQCANKVHMYDEKRDVLYVDNSKCVNCHRCVTLCPAKALKIVKTDHCFKPSANYTEDIIKDIYRQADTGGVLLSSMGTPKSYPVYWDKILLNASQVTNPSIDPLREPMEIRTYLGKKPEEIRYLPDGSIETEKYPNLELKVPIMFSAMSYGSISKNAHLALAKAAETLGTFYNTGEGGLHEDLYKYGPKSGRSHVVL